MQFGVGVIIWGLKFRGPKCAICGLKYGECKIIWGQTFLEFYCPSHFLSIKFFPNWAADYLGVFEKGGLIIWRSEKIA